MLNKLKTRKHVFGTNLMQLVLQQALDVNDDVTSVLK